MNGFFTYKNLKKLLLEAKEIAPLVPYGEWRGERAIILGHDVDGSIRKAYKVYELEKELGIRSTFFVLTTTAAYNVLYPENRRMLIEMAGGGFEIGLHFDVSVYQDRSKESLQIEVDKEATILNWVVGREVVQSVCLHNPGTTMVFPSFKGYRNTCDTYSRDRVLVDSRRDFKGIDPFSFIKRAEKEFIALWLHPINYSETGAEKYVDVFEFDNRVTLERIEKGMLGNEKYREELGEENLYDYIWRKR